MTALEWLFVILTAGILAAFLVSRKRTVLPEAVPEGEVPMVEEFMWRVGLNGKEPYYLIPGLVVRAMRKMEDEKMTMQDEINRLLERIHKLEREVEVLRYENAQRSGGLAWAPVLDHPNVLSARKEDRAYRGDFAVTTMGVVEKK